MQICVHVLKHSSNVDRTVYHFRQERELKTSTQGAQVFYELDQADDFDEDDPDDDLDI